MEPTDAPAATLSHRLVVEFEARSCNPTRSRSWPPGWTPSGKVRPCSVGWSDCGQESVT
jgi:hypothetical protein